MITEIVVIIDKSMCCRRIKFILKMTYVVLLDVALFSSRREVFPASDVIIRHLGPGGGKGPLWGLCHNFLASLVWLVSYVCLSNSLLHSFWNLVFYVKFTFLTSSNFFSRRPTCRCGIVWTYYVPCWTA